MSPVEFSGHDNCTFRLGEELLIRLPSAERYVAQVEKEQMWLPKLSPRLEMKIPSPVAMGQPNNDYPWPCSIYNWIEGDSVNTITLSNTDLNQLAVDLAKFLKALQKIDPCGGPVAGEHNYHRGGLLSVYDESTKESLSKLGSFFDIELASQLWSTALSSSWQYPAVWVHGDVASGNLLVKDNKLTAVIDFGCMGIGDPACDLVIAWTLFSEGSRALFKKHMELDAATWQRARGWALWKAAFELAGFESKNNKEAQQRLNIITNVLQEYEGEGNEEQFNKR